MRTLFQHGVPETRRELISGGLTGSIIGAAIEVHSTLGPGLLESVYEECLCHELHLRGLAFTRQIDLPVEFKGVRLGCGYRIDIVVADEIVVEIKAVERVLPVHEAQLMTYLRISGKHVGLLLNFGAPALNRGGVIRKIL